MHTFSQFFVGCGTEAAAQRQCIVGQQSGGVLEEQGACDEFGVSLTVVHAETVAERVRLTFGTGAVLQRESNVANGRHLRRFRRHQIDVER